MRPVKSTYAFVDIRLRATLMPSHAKLIQNDSIVHVRQKWRMRTEEYCNNKSESHTDAASGRVDRT